MPSVSWSETPFDLSQIAATSGIASLEYQAEVSSTNDWALTLSVDDQRACPLLVLTAKQTGGRGRGVNRWWSGEGALTFSLVVDAASARLAPDRWPLIALATGLAVCEGLHQLFPSGIFGLKWPNDVYLHGRKVCGILVEAPSHERQRIVIGVGINVNNSLEAPSELREKATSLCDEAGGTFDLSETLVAVLRRMNDRLAELRDARSFADHFHRYCLLTGRTVQVNVGRESILGRCNGIDDAGALIVQTANGELHLHAGTVIHWE